jgi:hypothetical protein
MAGGRTSSEALHEFSRLINYATKSWLLVRPQATPRLSEDKVKQCVDPKLKDDYPPKAVAKVRR